MKTQRGFTLIEIMVVVVILGILATLIVPKIMGRPEQARIVKMKQDVLAIESALDLYKLDHGVYPTTDQGLKALVSTYLQKLPIDPWGQAYQYTNENNTVHIDSPHTTE